MSLLQYGSLYMNMVRCHKYDRQAVYSGPNYLYHKHRLQVECILNPGTQANRFAGSPRINNQNNYGLPLAPSVPNQRQSLVALPPPPSGFPGASGNVPGVASDEAIRHLLLQPRQQLLYSMLGYPILTSPLPGFLSDVTGGPFPHNAEVMQIGPRTFHVLFDVQTDVNESTQFTLPGYLPIVLAHSWSMEQVIDKNWFSARVIEGRITFRLDLLNQLSAVKQLATGNLLQPGLVPDDFRYLLFHPISPGCKREEIHVKAEDDGCTIKYRIVDREYVQGWNDPNISEIDAEHIYNAGFDPVLKLLAGHVSLSEPMKLFNIIPQVAHTIRCKATGTNAVSTNYVEKYVLRILNARYAAIKVAFLMRVFPDNPYGNIQLNLAGFGATVHHYLTKNAVEAELSVIGPADWQDAVPLDITVNRVGSDQTFETDANGNQLLNPNGGPQWLLSSFQVPPVGPSDDKISRGTVLERIVGSALQPLNQPPTLPLVSPGIRLGQPLFGLPGPAPLLG